MSYSRKEYFRSSEWVRIDAKLTHVTDFAEIATYGIMSTPGLWIDGKIVSYGKVLPKDEIKEILKKL